MKKKNKTKKQTIQYRNTQYTKEKYLLAFMFGFVTMLLALIPIIICDDGYFIYYGDYNMQQIPFYNLVNDTVRSGQFGWNWFTDLGSDLLVSYSFYNITSPFFWLSVLLPRSLVTFSMPVLLALKHGFASLTSYIYIRRFVRSKPAALTGAMLYAFSGFQVFNIFFNHFQDVTAFFPLMLIAMEENICNRRRGWFAVIVSFMAVLNYYFFTGQVVFLIIYFFVRMPCRDFPVTFKKFLGLFAEAVLGTAIACVVLLPSALGVLENYRVNIRLYGEDYIVYRTGSRIIRIIQTFFLPSDMPARPNLFKSDNIKWSSLGGYLPLFSMLGVITFMRTKKKHWAVRLSWICIFCSFIPILNSMFYTFNGSYYARWFYMPILIFAMMTARTLDEDNVDFKPAFIMTGSVMVFFGLVSFIPEKKDGKLSWFTLPYDFGYFWLTFAFAAVFFLFAAYIIDKKNKGINYEGPMVYFTAFASFACVLLTMIYGAESPMDSVYYVDKAIRSKDQVYEEVSEDNFFRVDISENCDNMPMIWGLPNMRAFQSVVSTSIMDFYDSIGIQRDVASRVDVTHYTLRGLFSVKYFYREIVFGRTYNIIHGDDTNGNIFNMSENIIGSADDKAGGNDRPENNFANEIGSTDPYDSDGIRASMIDITEYLPGFEYIKTNDSFEVYENTLYIPPGFGYDTYISQEKAESRSKSTREKLLISALVLTDEQIEKYSDIMTEAPSSIFNFTKSDYIAACREKQQNCSDSFTWDSKGFESEITLKKPELVFFSVPYSKGWTAEVNGQPADIERVSYGFMAVRAEAGKNTITFRYATPGLKIGFIISIGGLVLLVIFVVLCRIGDKKQKFRSISHYYDYDSCQKITAAETYIRNCVKK